MGQSWIGRSLPRREDDPLLRGAGRFVADLTRPGQIHAHFVRSPVAHARLLDIDATAALALPGVAGVFTALDFPAGTLPPFLWDTPPEKLGDVEQFQPPLVGHALGRAAREGDGPLVAGAGCRRLLGAALQVGPGRPVEGVHRQLAVAG